MKFSEYYKSIANKKEKQALRDNIISKTGIQYSSFYSWLQRGKMPLTAKKIISDLVGKPINELFPESIEITD